MNKEDINNKGAEPKSSKRREIKSFVVRSARMTESQQKAYDRHMEKWSVPSTINLISSETTHSNSQPLTLEIGFGMGDSLAQMAEAMPQENFLGIEVHQAGIGRLLSLVEKKQLENVRVICGDAVKVLKQRIKNNSIARVNIYFPDPWHKTRHHKRRLIQHDFIELLGNKIQTNGLLHIATDWQPYANYILQVMQSQKYFTNIAGDKAFSSAKELNRPETKFERRGLRLGHGVWDMAFRMQS